MRFGRLHTPSSTLWRTLRLTDFLRMLGFAKSNASEWRVPGPPEISCVFRPAPVPACRQPVDREALARSSTSSCGIWARAAPIRITPILIVVRF
ncbi:jg9663 [Pararge aegeria aegeria]|uniref:Jg9663 protein n=1 Tax=Pararge aegeria aegeria TaxID=348720 RepID=A0A8S4RTC8_9NEOP|nr:jg9663 [Pararge aegeria aegeria]